MMNPLASAQSGSGNTRAIGRFDRTGGSRARRKSASERFDRFDVNEFNPCNCSCVRDLSPVGKQLPQ